MGAALQRDAVVQEAGRAAVQVAGPVLQGQCCRASVTVRAPVPVLVLVIVTGV